jgi:hypothetical protein
MRGVRIEACRHVLRECIEVQHQDADWPMANANPGNLYLRLGASTRR